MKTHLPHLRTLAVLLTVACGPGLHPIPANPVTDPDVLLRRMEARRSPYTPDWPGLLAVEPGAAAPDVEAATWLDKLLLGTIVGSFGFWAGAEWYYYLKEKNHGHAYFPFQKVVMPISPLIILSIIFYFITK